MRRRVAITGLGLISPYGGDLEDFFQRLLAGESAARHLLTQDQPRPISMPFVGCPGFDAQAELGKPLALMMERFAHLGLVAALRAWADAGLEKTPAPEEPRDNWGCIWGTSIGGVEVFERGYRDLWVHQRQRISPLSVVLSMNNAVNAHISMQLAQGGISTSHAAACASSAIAIGEAFRRIRAGDADVMVCGGSDATSTFGVLRGWEAMRLIAPGEGAAAAQACRPFAADRAGLVLGEGGAALVLEDWGRAQARGARIYAEIVGYGSSCDHSHLVRPDQAGQVRALHAALRDGALEPEEIGYVNAHGTATQEGDPTEIAALQTVFGARAQQLPVSATKSMHGHLLGTAGAIEALTTVLALARQALPPTAHLAGRIDPACAGVDHVLHGRRGVPVAAALSNSFAFGGSNAVLAFRAAPV